MYKQEPFIDLPGTVVKLLSFLSPGVDGWLARRLGQCSRFGAWLDVVVDNLGRGMLWSLLFKVNTHAHTPPYHTNSCS